MGLPELSTWSRKLLINIHKQLVTQNTCSGNNNENKSNTLIMASCRGKMITKDQEENYQALSRGADLSETLSTENFKCIMAGVFFLVMSFVY